MISYRQYEIFAQTQAEKTQDKYDNFRAASYQRYQGQKLADRFNAFTYWILTKVMDNHHVGRGRASLEEALSQITARALIIGIHNDLLFPISEQRYLARHIPQAEVEIIHSTYGHDGFLVEFDQLNTILKHFYREKISVLS
jgi:homoserine O-acetyltransferase